MTRKDIDFMLAYADVYGMMDRPVYEVWCELTKLYEEGREATEGTFNWEEYKNEFLEKYHDMKEYKLDDEIKFYTIILGYDFFQACTEWDI